MPSRPCSPRLKNQLAEELDARLKTRALPCTCFFKVRPGGAVASYTSREGVVVTHEAAWTMEEGTRRTSLIQPNFNQNRANRRPI